VPRLAANLSFLFQELAFLERFDAARRCGFRGVEFHFPYAFEAGEVARAARDAGVETVLFNLPAGDWASGERGIACQAGREAEFRVGVMRALEYARALGCTRLNCLAGIAPTGADDAGLRATLIANLRFAAPALVAHNTRLLLEPINRRDMPGFLVHRSDQALEIIAAAACDNLYLQYDIYHAQVSEGDLARRIADHFPRIAHMQLADNPGRHEPGTGEINFPFLLSHIDRLGYDGWIGCEYIPCGGTEASLAWAAPWLAPKD
jgi:hydroxypyruvate isomerase